MEAAPGAHSGRRWVAVVVLAVTALVVAGLRQHAADPAVLVSAEPAVDARLATPPAAVALTFSGPLDPAATHLEVTGPDGSAVSGDLTVIGDTVEQEVAIAGEGPVLVTYHGVFRDGRKVSGQYEFLVGASSAEGREVAQSDGHSHGAMGPLASLIFLVIFLGGVGVLIVTFSRPRRGG
jgi:methionine-rich copper-binding protein CopC